LHDGYLKRGFGIANLPLSFCKAKTSNQPFPNPSSLMRNPPALFIIHSANRIPADAALCRRAGWQPVPFPLIHIRPESNVLAGLSA